MGVLGGRQIAAGDWIFFPERDGCLNMLEVTFNPGGSISRYSRTRDGCWAITASPPYANWNIVTASWLWAIGVNGCPWLRLPSNYNINVVGSAFTSYSLSVIMRLIQW